MRGTPPVVLSIVVWTRIIPAHAGNSRDGHRPATVGSDHPRACGELGLIEAAAPIDVGSSPRMRGTRALDDARVTVARIIPAHAGNSYQPYTASSTEPDHPRACGELIVQASIDLSVAGSSPRMRGTPVLGVPSGVAERIIPAHAGNSLAPLGRQPQSSDHPRACGELALDTAIPSTLLGSSPRMRGTLFPRTTTNTGFI